MDRDRALVDGARTGDQASLVALYERYYDRVYRYALSRLGSVADAEDLAQDTFLKMVDKLPSFRWKGPPFAAWLFRIAHNGVVDMLRRRAVRRTQVPIDAVQVAAAVTDDTGGLDDSLLLQDLINAMGKLTHIQQEVISLRFSAGLSVSEAAHALGKAEGTIRATQFQAIKALRRILIPNEGI